MLKRITLILLFASAVCVLNAQNIKGKWSLDSIKTTDQSLNAMIPQDEIADVLVEFTDNGFVKVSGIDTKTKYKVEKDKIVFSEGMAEKIKNPALKYSVKNGVLVVNVSEEIVKQIMLIVKDMYIEAGGDKFVASMIESAALSSKIEAVIKLKRK